MRIFDLAVNFDKLDKNRLKRVELPDVTNRQRVATKEELLALKRQYDKRLLKMIDHDEYDPSEFWRIVTVALKTGLRESKILELDRSWMRKRDDGRWLILPPSRSRLKQTPRGLPLNDAAYASLRSKIAHVDERLFRRGMRLRLGPLATPVCRGQSGRSALPCPAAHLNHVATEPWRPARSPGGLTGPSIAWSRARSARP